MEENGSSEGSTKHMRDECRKDKRRQSSKDVDTHAKNWWK